MLFKENAIDYLDNISRLEELGILDKVGDENSKYWNNIAIDYRFLKVLYNIFINGMTFLELGCGAGNVLRFAKNIGYSVNGIEIDDKLIKYLEEFDHMYENILNVDKTLYSKYDVIYSYVPLKENYVYFLENSVIPYMNKGSYLITPSTILNNKSLKMLQPFLYIKITDNLN